MKYSEMIPRCRTALLEREELEWSNFWWDSANDTDKSQGRVLIIGDSTARMIRSTLAKKMKKPVDMLATSAGLHDSLFINQVDCFFASTEYKYELIIIQIGHHAELGIGGGFYKEEDWIQFEEEFQILIDFLSQFTNRIVVESMFYSVVPNKKWKIAKLLKKKETYDELINIRKKRKNDIMQAIAFKNQKQYIDINHYMINEGKHFYHKDHIHYEDSAKIFIVEYMIRCIENYDEG